MDHSSDFSGEFGPRRYFSELYVRCIVLEFTGGILVRNEESECEGKIFFIRGQPFLVTGAAFDEAPLGEVLVNLGVIPREALERALVTQSTEDPNSLLGEILRKRMRLPGAELDRALEIQVRTRLAAAFALRRGVWHGLWSREEDIVSRGRTIDGLSVLVAGTKAATRDELSTFADELLGSAVNLTCSVDDTLKFGVTVKDRPIVELLDRPRKPDQLERVVENRNDARAVLKALSLAGVLERSPAARGVPIANSRRRSAAAGWRVGGDAVPASTVPPPPTPPAQRKPDSRAYPSSTLPPPMPRRLSTVPPALAGATTIAREIEELHASLEEKSFFELLGVKENAGAADVRARYAELVRKFHPDAIAQINLAKASLDKAAAISSRLNEAYRTLTDETAREEYLRLYRDARIRGSAKRKALLEEAERKFRMAQILLKKKDYVQARELFAFAAEKAPEDGRFVAFLAWSTWLDRTTGDRDQAKVLVLLRRAIELAPADVDAHYFMGSVLKVTGDASQAQTHFRRCIQLQPSHHEATRELRLMRMRGSR